VTEDGTRPPRRRRSREDTENELLDATLRLLDRDGVLAGITLRDVAKEAGVNHGQIYQYFGDRQTLLRAAINRLVTAAMPDPERHWDRPFAERRRTMWRRVLEDPDTARASRLEALLALDGDPQLTLFPAIDRTRAALERDRENGELAPDADGEVMHALTAATYLGYSIFREAIARDLDIDPGDLDRRAGRVYDQMLKGLSSDAAATLGHETVERSADQ
jgi:AcrR family transcriptional regulator